MLDAGDHLNKTYLSDGELADPKRSFSASNDRNVEIKRPISVGLRQLKQEAAEYLRQQYTDTHGEMICQICKAHLPFRLDDGSDYFEAVEFLPALSKRHYQNYLALCPTHAAMFRYAKSSSQSLAEDVLHLVGNELEIMLAREMLTIHLTNTHLADLQRTIKFDRAASGAPDG